jgi:cyclic pyranopterin phosphate synthase
MPETEQTWKDRNELLSYEEIQRLAKIFISMGIQKIRITGGEAMLRRNLEVLIRSLGALPGLLDLALTTNGFHLESKAKILKQAGLRRINISLDTLDPERFILMTGKNYFHQVMRGIRAAKEAGLAPIKVNAVLIRNMNEGDIPAFVELARELDIHVRFIEFMPLDSGRFWRRDLVVPGREVFDKINALSRLVPETGDPSETAQKYVFEDGVGHIGLISSVTEPFCGQCSRIRLTADGMIRTCLFSIDEHDLKSLMRKGADDNELARFISRAVDRKEDRHHINDVDFVQPPRTMSCIGG